MKNKFNVLIADDHQIILDGICAYLENEEEFKIVAQAKNGRDVLKLLKKKRNIDIAVIDINMPLLDGIETTLAIKQEFPHVKVLILSMHHKIEFVKKLMEAGAMGYILKDDGRKELVKALRRIAAGQKYFSSQIMKESFDLQYLDEVKTTLTKREMQVVALIAEGLSSQEIAKNLNLSQHTIDSHRKNILFKIDGKNPVDILKYGLKTGIVKGFDMF